MMRKKITEFDQLKPGNKYIVIGRSGAEYEAKVIPGWGYGNNVLEISEAPDNPYVMSVYEPHWDMCNIEVYEIPNTPTPPGIYAIAGVCHTEDSRIFRLDSEGEWTEGGKLSQGLGAYVEKNGWTLVRLVPEVEK